MTPERQAITIVTAILLTQACVGLAQDTMATTPTCTNCTTTLSHVIQQPCALASISTTDHSVTVDWDCVEKNAAEFRSGVTKHGSVYPGFAQVMKAIRDGTAKERAP